MIDNSLFSEAHEAADALATVLDASAEYAILCEDEQGIITHWNEGARRLYSFDADEVIGKSSAETLYPHEDVTDGKLDHIRDGALRDGRWEGIVSQVRSNGQRIDVHVVVTPRRTSSGEVIGFLLVARNSVDQISFVQRRHGAALFDRAMVSNPQEAVDFIANVLESSTEYSIIGKDLDGKILLWNEGARRLYGYEPQEVVGKANSSILHTPEDVAAGRPGEILNAALRDGKWEGTLVRVRRSGERFPARIVITPRRDVNSKPIGFLLISKDISEEIRLTEQLKASEYYTRSLIESNIDALMTTDPIGIITDVNQQMKR